MSHLGIFPTVIQESEAICEIFPMVIQESKEIFEIFPQWSGKLRKSMKYFPTRLQNPPLAPYKPQVGHIGTNDHSKALY